MLKKLIGTRDKDAKRPTKPTCALLVGKYEDLLQPYPRVDGLRVQFGVGNSQTVSQIDLRCYPVLRELIIGDECFQYVSELVLDGFERLEKVETGMRCFTKTKGTRFEISECYQLQTIKIGKRCFSNWTAFLLKACGSLQRVEIDNDCFPHCAMTCFEGLSSRIHSCIDLPGLEVISLGSSVFKGDCENSELIMRSS